MRTSRNAPDHLATIGESLGELASDAAADVRHGVELGSGLVADVAARLGDVAAETLTDVRRDLAARIEPERPSRRGWWLLAGGIAAAVAVALWAILSRRPQQVEDEPVRAVPHAVPSDGGSASGGGDASDGAVPSAATRNGHSSD
ncbi:hypothetical protein [Pseudonocardia sp. D17]|uniref:hypothetical protein n=1 Tax=Pseudonocardia sp. D17 TaxID=882661 RepID=UPI002B3C5715|nr:hypothetical protein PSD17_11350 [Pseudonocardia sp. D17]